MREILFRGKRLDNGEWVDGYLAAYDLICQNYPEYTSNATGDYYGQTPYVGFVEVDPSAVGQYTGLKDKHGKRIFEEDIVKTSDITHEGVIQIPGESFEIAMRKGCWVMVAGEDWDFLETNHECIEVIGNIHDNPELLKGGEG